MKAKSVPQEMQTLEEEREAVHQGLEGGEVPEAVSLGVELLEVRREYKSDGRSEDADTEVLSVRDFLVPPANVGVELARTVNMGNYESIRVTVSLKLPCYAEEAVEAYGYALGFCRDRIDEEVSLAVENAKGRNSRHAF